MKSNFITSKISESKYFFQNFKIISDKYCANKWNFLIFSCSIEKWTKKNGPEVDKLEKVEELDPEEAKPDGEAKKSKSKKKIKKKKKSKKSKPSENLEKDGTVLAITVDESEPNQGEVLLLVAEEEPKPDEAALVLVTDDKVTDDKVTDDKVTDDKVTDDSGEIVVIDQLSRQSSRGQPHVVILEVPKEQYTPVNYEVVPKPDESIVVENGESVVPDNSAEIIIISVPEEESFKDEEDLAKKKRKKKKSKSRHNLNQQALEDILAHEQVK